MSLRRAEVKHFVAVCEKIQALLAQGTRLEQDERDLIEFCVCELRNKIRASHAAA